MAPIIADEIADPSEEENPAVKFVKLLANSESFHIGLQDSHGKSELPTGGLARSGYSDAYLDPNHRMVADLELSPGSQKMPV